MGEVFDFPSKKFPSIGERIAWRIHTASTSDFPTHLGELELYVDYERSMAAHGLAVLLRDKLMSDGYIIISDIDDAVNEFCEADLVDPDAPDAC